MYLDRSIRTVIFRFISKPDVYCLLVSRTKFNCEIPSCCLIICVRICIKVYVHVHVFVLVLQDILFSHIYTCIRYCEYCVSIEKVSQKKYGRFVKQNLIHHYKMVCYVLPTLRNNVKNFITGYCL